MADDDDDFVEDVLLELRRRNYFMNRKKPELDGFLKAVRAEMRNYPCRTVGLCTFLPTGGGYERSAVSQRADFDIALILPYPYRGSNLDALETKNPGYYRLQWRFCPGCVSDSTSDDESECQFQCAHSNTILNVEGLRDHIFEGMLSVLGAVRDEYPQWNLQARSQHSALVIYITDDDGEQIRVDMVPQIADKFWNCLPGVCDVGDLPPCLQRCTSKNFQYPILYSLAPAPHMSDDEYGDQLVTATFSMIEKHCMKVSDSIKEAVMLVKLVSNSRKWKLKYGLRPFHIKRVAIKYFEQLDGIRTWIAFEKLLSYLASELYDGKIDGYFIDYQDVFLKSRKTCTQLAHQIMHARSSINPHNLSNYLN